MNVLILFFFTKDKTQFTYLPYYFKGSDTYVFQCGRWLARDEDDYSISRELIPDKKLQEIMTSSGQAKVKEVKLRDKLTSKFS